MEAVSKGLTIHRVDKSRITEVDFDNIPFGRVFSDHMLVANHTADGWQTPEIRPYSKIQVSPSISALHYGQSIFEGMKAYRDPQGQPLLFRPEENFKRMNRSAYRMAMPELPREIFMDGLYELIRLDHDWIPSKEGSSLYIRPFMFATDEYVGIRPSTNYKFIIFTCPVGAYYAEPVNLTVNTSYIRAAKGGTGEAKVAGNYAGSLLGAREAMAEGYHNIMWLDAHEQRYVEECGTMNMFFVIDGRVVTSPLTGTILPGITRDSVLSMLKKEGRSVEVRRVSTDELWQAYNEGRLTEAFGAGTAATIAHVNKIRLNQGVMQLPPVEGREVSNFLLKRLSDIRLGLAPDPYNWVVHL